MALLVVFAGWTVFVWGTRISNILSDGGGAVALVSAIALTGLGVLVAVAALTRRPTWAPGALAVATVVAWLARVPSIVLGGHGAAFVAVHLVLAATSLALAGAVLTKASPRSRSRVSRRRQRSVRA